MVMMRKLYVIHILGRGCNSVGRVLAWHKRNSRLDCQRHTNWAWWCMPVTPATRKRWQENQEVQGHPLRPAWDK